jgi:hypothetical protein
MITGLMKNNLTQKLATGAAALGVLAGVGLASAPAQAVSLGSLIPPNNGTITAGDKRFSNFTCVRTGISGTPPNCDIIDVTPLLVPGDFGLEFSAGFLHSGPNSLDFLIGYDVEATDPNKWISDIQLSFNGAVTGDGFTNVVETITNLDPTCPQNTQIQVTNPPESLTARKDLACKAKKVHVTKDILLRGGTTGIATISFIDQRFSQVTERTPEPSSVLGLLAFGGLGLGMLRKKQG